jgi:hypothetical protein
MDFGNLISRAWDTLWKNAFLILLGALAVLGNAFSSSTFQGRYVFQGGEFPWQELRRFDFIRPFSHGDFSAWAMGGILILVIALVLFCLVFWAMELIARGGMISAVDDLERGKPTSIVTALKAAWEKGWRLLGIGLIPAIPGLILLIIVVSNLKFSGFRFYSGVDMGWNGLQAFAPLLFLTCLFVPIMLLFSALQAFANRACMMEDTGVIESYRRGLEVLGGTSSDPFYPAGGHCHCRGDLVCDSGHSGGHVLPALAVVDPVPGCFCSILLHPVDSGLAGMGWCC